MATKPSVDAKVSHWFSFLFLDNVQMFLERNKKTVNCTISVFDKKIVSRKLSACLRKKSTSISQLCNKCAWDMERLLKHSDISVVLTAHSSCSLFSRANLALPSLVQVAFPRAPVEYPAVDSQCLNQWEPEQQQVRITLNAISSL